MIKLHENGVFLIDGKPQKTADVSAEQAKKGTIAYKMLTAHNTSGNDNHNWI